MDAIAQLETNLQELFKRYTALQEEVRALREENDTQRQEILRTHSELNSLQSKYYRLQTASSLLGDEEQRERARQQLNYLVQLVDQAIDSLRKE